MKAVHRAVELCVVSVVSLHWKISGVTSGGGMGSTSNTVTGIIHYTMYCPTYNKNKHKVSSAPQFNIKVFSIDYSLSWWSPACTEPPDDMPGVEGWVEGERVTALLHYESGYVWCSPSS